VRTEPVPTPPPPPAGEKPPPEDENNKPPAGTFCMLSYQHLNTHLGAHKVAGVNELVVGDAMDLLQHNEVISVKGCWNPDGYDNSTLEAIADRQFELLSE
jgi:hypothetical protein